MPLKNTFYFAATLEKVKINLIRTVIFMPVDVVLQLPKGRLRVNGLMNGAPFSLSIQYRKDGTRYFPVSSMLRRAAKIQPGDVVDITFTIVEPDKVEIPEELETTALHRNAEASKVQPVSPLRHYIHAVKQIDSRIRRAIEAVQKAGPTRPYDQQKKSKKKKNP